MVTTMANGHVFYLFALYYLMMLLCCIKARRLGLTPFDKMHYLEEGLQMTNLWIFTFSFQREIAFLSGVYRMQYYPILPPGGERFNFLKKEHLQSILFFVANLQHRSKSEGEDDMTNSCIIIYAGNSVFLTIHKKLYCFCHFSLWKDKFPLFDFNGPGLVLKASFESLV